MKFQLVNFICVGSRLRGNDKLNEGFSLIELIVVITIIAVVTVVGVVNFSGTNTKARDGRRMADLEKIRVALELARQIGGTYPVNAGATNAPSQLAPGYIQALPQDPKTGFGYYYAGTGYSYTLDAQMENLGSTNGSFGSSCGGTCNYRVTSP